MRVRFRNLLLTLMILSPLPAFGQLIVASSPGENPPPANTVETTKLVLHPAAEPRPALRYQLLPPLVERRPGNAAVIYGKAAAQLHSFGDSEFDQKASSWLDVPLADFPRDAVEFSELRPCFELLDLAARCNYVDWQLPLFDQPPFEILLPELSQNRSFARMVAARARMHLAAGEMDEAIRSLQTGYALGRHVGQEPTIISGLVGIAIANIMSKQVETLIQQPDAPNLYWALTQLPDPLIDMRVGIEAESALLVLWFPQLGDIENRDLSTAQWNEELRKLMEGILSLNGQQAGGMQTLASTALALRGYPIAKRGLVAWGYEPDEVEEMPVAQVILLYTVRQYREIRDDLFKWLFVPYWESGDGAARANEELKTIGPETEIIPLASTMLPAISAVHRRDAEIRRTIAALRVIEAIRLYGADHDGRLPTTLADITAVPVPNDPTTGKPFEYELTGKTAVLQSPGEGRDGLRYEIIFAEKGN